MIRLAHVHRQAQVLGAVFQAAGNIVERVVTIDGRLAHAQKVEVRAVEHEHHGRGGRGGGIGHGLAKLLPGTVRG